MSQSLLVMTTDGCRPQRPASRVVQYRVHAPHKAYGTPLEAIDDGWRLMAPPVMVTRMCAPFPR